MSSLTRLVVISFDIKVMLDRFNLTEADTHFERHSYTPAAIEGTFECGRTTARKLFVQSCHFGYLSIYFAR